MRDGAVMHPGRLGGSVLVDEGQAAARRPRCRRSRRSARRSAAFERLEGIAQVTVYIASTPEFVEHPTVANGASELLVEVLGEPGRHARAAIGMASLPLGASVEVQVTAELVRAASRSLRRPRRGGTEGRPRAG